MTQTLSLLIAGLAGLAAGAAAAWLFARGEVRRQQERVRIAEQESAVAASRLLDLDERHRQEVETIAERLKTDLYEANERVAEKQRDQFLALAGQRFETAEERANARLSDLVKPVAQKLTEFDAFVKSMEKDRIGAYEGLREQIAGLMERGGKLESETAHLATQTRVLVTALRNPAAAGKWGEVQLRRVVELAGMLGYCDFDEQRSIDGGEAGRPDMTVHLPGNSNIYVDAKAPLAAYIDAVEATDDAARRERLRGHAAAMKAHVDALARRNYQQAEDSADFVVMFVPGEAFLSAACTENPDLIEYGAGKNVYIASPLTLMALLRSYAFGWQQRRQEENAKRIAELGRELYERVRVFAGHFNAIGSSLQKAVGAYNSAVGSMESRVLPQGRRLKEAASLTEPDLPEAATLDIAPREIAAQDVLPKPDTPAG